MALGAWGFLGIPWSRGSGRRSAASSSAPGALCLPCAADGKPWKEGEGRRHLSDDTCLSQGSRIDQAFLCSESFDTSSDVISFLLYRTPSVSRQVCLVKSACVQS